MSTLFLNCNGSNVYTTLGLIDKIKDKIKPINIWNVTGNASLIMYFRILGYTAHQTFQHLKKHNLINSMINGYSFIPEDEEEKKDFIYSFLIEIMEACPIINKNMNLKEIEKLTGITPCFIMWCRSKKEIININPSLEEDYNFVECVMASLCNIGVYQTYDLTDNKGKEEKFSTLETIECFPILELCFKKKEEIFYIANITSYNKKYSFGRDLGPLAEIEDELLMQKAEYGKHRIEGMCKSLKDADICKLYSYYSRGNSSDTEKDGLFILGHKQGTTYLEKGDTKETAREYLRAINSQR